MLDAGPGRNNKLEAGAVHKKDYTNSGMFAPEPRGRIVALDVLVFEPMAPLPAQWMLVAKTTRFDDGHLNAWYVEQSHLGRWFPARSRLEPSLLCKDQATLSAAGLSRRCPIALDCVPLRLDELQAVCLRSPLPDVELGEDERTWCLDVLVQLERRRVIVRGQALELEESTHPPEPCPPPPERDSELQEDDSGTHNPGANAQQTSSLLLMPSRSSLAV